MSIPWIFKTLALLSLLIATACAPMERSPVSASSRATLAPSGPAPLELTVLGSGGPGAVGRAATCFVLSLDGAPRILIDAGPGSFTRLGETGLSLDHLDLILLTHLHIDHTGELPGILLARAVDSGAPVHFQIFGPTGAGQFPSTKRFVDLLFGPQGAFAYLEGFSAPMTIDATDVDATVHSGARPQTLLDHDGLKIDAIAGHHFDAPAIIYRVDYKGRSVVFSGDIDPLGLEDLRLIADHCDLLVFNTVVLDPPHSPAILYALHTPPKRIGEVAGAAHVGALLLTHLNPSIDQAHAEVLASIRRSYVGPVTFAEDDMRVTP
ncbi:MAG: MBL fold metallo-hydrolase [Tepidisphaeraceae bacterium]|jgi:ribonuclease BN (tRNA processing enzyme)